VSYLPKKKQDTFRRELNKAFNEPTYEGAKAAIQVVRKKLKVINERAVKSLDEGREEHLTLHRLGVFENWRGVLRVQIV
jgi:transposase-like protein